MAASVCLNNCNDLRFTFGKNNHFIYFYLSETTGERTIEETVPDTISTWYANGYALSPSVGIGVATSASVKAFQPFFISLSLPYSVIRSETLKIPATLFNYLDDCLVVSFKYTLHKRWSFPLRISLVDVTKSLEYCGLGHIYWKNPKWKTPFLCSTIK